MYTKAAVVWTCTVVVVILGFSLIASAGDESEAALTRMSLPEVCRHIGMPCDYDFRMKFVTMLFRNGVRLFDEGANDDSHSYFGSSGQNGRLARNLMFNRHLFQSGALPAENVKKWRVVY
jgi:hypothetical protein